MRSEQGKATIRRKPSQDETPSARSIAKPERTPVERPDCFGFPGPPERKEGEPLRVLVCNRVAREEGQECWADYLAKGMEEDVEWRYIVGLGDANLLREHGEVSYMSGDYEDRWWDFFRVVWDFRPHVVHTSYRMGAEFAKRAGLPCLCTVHGIEEGESYGGSVADVAVGVSPAVQDVDTVVTSGVEPVEFAENKREDTVVWLGRTDEDRHPIPFLEALERLPNVNALIIGSSKKGEVDIQQEVYNRALQERVRVHGDLSSQEARDLAAEGQVIVSAVNESFGLATVEMMTAGLRPVVIEGPGYQTELANEYGVVVRSTIQGLIDGIKEGLRLAQDEEGNRRMAGWARSNYSCREMARGYYEIYEDLVRPVIDVVVLAWNELEATKACVNSILANTWTPFRLIMLDNGSEEPVAEFFKNIEATHDNAVAVCLDENLGAPGGRNYIYEHFDENDFFFWLDNDILPQEGWLGPLYDIMRTDEQIGAISPWNTVYQEEARGKEPRDGIFHGTANLFRRSAVEDVRENGVFSEPFASMSGRADTDLLCRIKEGGYRLILDGTIHLYHFGGHLQNDKGQGLTRRHGNVKQMEAAEKEFQAKWESFGKRRSGYRRNRMATAKARIMFCVPHAWWGGLHIWTEYLAKYLPNDKFEKHMLVYRSLFGGAEALRELGIVHMLPPDKSRSQCGDAIRSIFAEVNPYVVQANAPDMAQAAHELGIPCVTTAHSMKGPEANGSEFADRVFRVSPAIPGNCPVIFNGVDQPPSMKREENLIVYLGRLDEDRNPEVLFEAFNELYRRRQDFRVKVIGASLQGPFVPEAFQWEEGLEERIELTGLLRHDDALREVAVADIITAPWPEGFGLGVAEGMRCGAIPVVADEGGGPFVVGDYGITVGKTIDEIADGFEQAIDDDGLRGQRDKIRRYAAQRYDAKRFSAEYARHYEEMV